MEAQVSALDTNEKEVILTLELDASQAASGDLEKVTCNDCVWTGGFKPANSNEFQWNNSSEMTFEYFHDGAGSWEFENQACVAIVQDGEGWSAMNCNTRAKFACERYEGFGHITEGIEYE